MNKTESRYERELAVRKLAEDVVWYEFEGVKLRLADNTFLTVDFAVLPALRDEWDNIIRGADGKPKEGVLEMHDVKGSAFQAADQSDGRAKIKVAAGKYPFRFKLVWPRKAREGGGWEVEEL